MEKNSQKNSFIENLHLDLALTLTVSHSTTFLSSCFCEVELIHQGKYVAGLKTDLQFVRKCFFRGGLVATVLELDNL